MIARAGIHGAVSIVNAIATGRGATLGIDLGVRARVETSRGSGIAIESETRSISSRLITKTIQRVVPKKELEKNRVRVVLESDIPVGYGLKSSSAISSSVALACTRLFRGRVDDSQVLLAGVNASIETRVSVTGAYDDACACYYGGFVVTDNHRRRIVHSQKSPKDLFAVILVPKSRKRGNIKKLKSLTPVFERAWSLARKSDYWNAMVLNGLATSAILDSSPGIIADLMGRGALGASVSGNGPAIAAVTKKANINGIKKVFSALDGRIITSRVNNKKAEVHVL